MSRIVALDIGDARIGVAAQDELGIITAPISTIHRTNSIKKDVKQIVDLIDELKATKIIIGYPIDFNDNEGFQTVKVKDFYTRLSRRLDLPVILWDERFSTQEAEELLLEMNFSRNSRREVIDQFAALVILRSYLN